MKEQWRLNALDRYATHYADIWRGIERDWASGSDAFWLMGAANYIFRAGGARWAVDPMFNTPRSGVALDQIDPAPLLNSLDFALITHRHADHFDPRLMARFPNLNWIVPDHMASLVPEVCHARMTVVRPGEVIRRGGMIIEAFSGLHFDAGTTIGVEETGYLVDTGAARLLFPGDVRDYDAAGLPAFEGVTHLFAHVWLGRGNAQNWPCGDYPEAFARFMLSFGAETIYLAHLMEAERPLCSLWTYAHAGLVTDALLGMNPGAHVAVPLPGRAVIL